MCMDIIIIRTDGMKEVGGGVKWRSAFKVKLKVNGRGERSFRVGGEHRDCIPH